MNRTKNWAYYFLILSLCLIVEPLALFWKAEGADTAIFLFSYVALVSAVAIFSIYLFGKVYEPAFNYLISVYAVVSIISLKLLYFQVFGRLPVGILLLISCIIATLSFFLIRVSRPTITLYVGTVLILVCAPTLLKHKELLGQTETFELSSEEETFLKQLSEIQLKDRPNIYYLSFDSMIPTSSAQEFLGISELGYDRVLGEHFHILEPSVAFYVPTKLSLNSIMRLDQKQLSRSIEYFNGKRQSAISSVFSNNGYEVSTGYPTYYFGKKGPYIDRYVVAEQVSLSNTVLCISEGNVLLHQLKNFGACGAIGGYQGFGGFISNISGIQAGKRNKSFWHNIWLDRVKNELKRAASSRSPQFLAFHTYSPIGHTTLEYDHSNLNHRERFKAFFERESKELKDLLEEIASLIREVDSNSIVVVSGDHGIWVSRGIELADNPGFFVEDRHIVRTAVMATEHRCANEQELSKFNAANYYSPSRILAAVINCLSDNNNIAKLFQFDEPTVIIESLLRKQPPTPN